MKYRWVNFTNFILVLLCVFVGVLVYHLFVVPQTREAARLLINILKPLSALLVTVLLFMVTRNIVKLYFARKRGAAGTRLQTKLVLSLLPLTVLPSVVFFFLSTRFLDDLLLDVTTESDEAKIVRSADAFVNEHFQQIQRLLSPHGGPLIERFKGNGVGSLQTYLDQFDIDGAEFYEQGVFQHRVIRNGFPQDKAPRFGQTARYFGPSDGEHPALVDHFTDGFLVARFPFRQEEITIHILASMDSEYTERYLFLRDTANYLHLAKVKTNQLLGLNRGIMLFTAIAVVFGGIWLGQVVSRRFMEGFNTVIEGAKQLSAGNFDTHLDLATGDEMEDVLHAFNAMTETLKSNRTELEEKAHDLSTLNAQLSGQIQYNQAILQQTSAGILSTDTENLVQTFNPAAKKILGIEGFRKGLVFPDLLSEKRHRMLKKLWQDFQDRKPRALFRQLELQNEDQVTYVAASMVPLEWEGSRFGNLIVLEDLTQLMTAQKIAAWQEVARRVAHEIKNPLTPIQLSIERIRRKALQNADDLKEAVASAHDTIMSETALLKNLVDEFSAFAKMPVPAKTETNLGDLVDNLFQAYEPVYPDVELVRELPERKLTLNCDPSQLRQVLSNLIHNAASASSPRGKITIKMSRAEEKIKINVLDEGIGIPESEQEKVFMPYYSKSPKGTGLGLAIVKRIVEDHGGEIRVTTNHPSGANFEITLPAQA